MSEPILPKKKRLSQRRSAPLNVNLPSIERHAIDRLLLVIIDGYPDEDDLASATWHARRLRRLQEARKALFADDDITTEQSDHEIAALRMMAAWHHRDSQLQAMRHRDPECLPTVDFDKPRSIRRLALEASIKVKGESRIDFIEKIRKQFARKQKYYLDLMNHDNDIELMQEFNALTRALDGLARLGVRLARPKP